MEVIFIHVEEIEKNIFQVMLTFLFYTGNKAYKLEVEFVSQYKKNS